VPIGTPEDMTSEQADLAGHDVDTRFPGRATEPARTVSGPGFFGDGGQIGFAGLLPVVTDATSPALDDRLQ
jgi:hypothetical protein